MALIDRSLMLVERGDPIVIPEAGLQAAGLEDPLTRLAERGIVGLRTIGAFHIVEPRQFVGRVGLPGRRIAISPRDPELFSALHRFVARAPAKLVETQEKIVDVEEPVPADPAVAFVRALEEAVSAGVPFFYDREVVTTSRPRGRWLVSQTLRALHTRGVRHRVLCAVPSRNYDSQLCSVVETVAFILQSGHILAPQTWLALDTVRRVFEGGGEVLGVAQAIAVAEALAAQYADRAELERLLSVASTILRNEHIVWDEELAIPGGVARFCNVDRLWEKAVWTAFTSVTGGKPDYRAELHPLGRTKITLFENGGPEIDPDLILYHKGQPAVVADAKYTMATQPNADDVYQIVCYSRRVRARRALLLYLTKGEPWFHSVGSGSDGYEVLAAGVPTQSAPAGLVAVATSVLGQL